MTDVRSAEPRDIDAWVRMRTALWPADVAEHRASVERFFSGHRHEPAEVLLAFGDDRTAVGFVELSIRNIVDSCESDRVAYLEGWYVDPSARRCGVGAALIAAAERWALQQGCTEFGSDSLIGNAVSEQAHLSMGF